MTKETEIVRDSKQIEIENIARAAHSDPFQVLGPHWTGTEGETTLTIKAFHPTAAEVSVLVNGIEYPATRIHPEGLFEIVLAPRILQVREDRSIPANSYRLRFSFAD